MHEATHAADVFLAPDARYSARFAAPWRRTAAAAIDWTLCLTAFLIVSIPLGAVQALGAVIAGDEGGGISGVVGRAVELLAQAGTLAPAVAYIAVLSATSQTAGMRALDIHLVTEADGRAPRLLWRSLARGLVATFFAAAVYITWLSLIGDDPIGGFSHRDMLVIDAARAICVAAILGKALLLLDSRRRSAQDLMFGTVVIDEVVPAVQHRPGPWGPLDQIDLAAPAPSRSR